MGSPGDHVGQAEARARPDVSRCLTNSLIACPPFARINAGAPSPRGLRLGGRCFRHVVAARPHSKSARVLPLSGACSRMPCGLRAFVAAPRQRSDAMPVVDALFFKVT
jgi:hypothetical protein